MCQTKILDRSHGGGISNSKDRHSPEPWLDEPSLRIRSSRRHRSDRNVCASVQSTVHLSWPKDSSDRYSWLVGHDPDVHESICHTSSVLVDNHSSNVQTWYIRVSWMFVVSTRDSDRTSREKQSNVLVKLPGVIGILSSTYRCWCDHLVCKGKLVSQYQDEETTGCAVDDNCEESRGEGGEGEDDDDEEDEEEEKRRPDIFIMHRLSSYRTFPLR